MYQIVPFIKIDDCRIQIRFRSERHPLWVNKYMEPTASDITLDLFASDPFKIMLSKGGFLWKLRNCGYSTEKTLFLMNLIIKLTLGNIFIKVKNPPGGATVTK